MKLKQAFAFAGAAVIAASPTAAFASNSDQYVTNSQWSGLSSIKGVTFYTFGPSPGNLGSSSWIRSLTTMVWSWANNYFVQVGFEAHKISGVYYRDLMWTNCAPGSCTSYYDGSHIGYDASQRLMGRVFETGTGGYDYRIEWWKWNAGAQTWSNYYTTISNVAHNTTVIEANVGNWALGSGTDIHPYSNNIDHASWKDRTSGSWNDYTQFTAGGAGNNPTWKAIQGSAVNAGTLTMQTDRAN